MLDGIKNQRYNGADGVLLYPVWQSNMAMDDPTWRCSLDFGVSPGFFLGCNLRPLKRPPCSQKGDFDAPIARKETAVRIHSGSKYEESSK